MMPEPEVDAGAIPYPEHLAAGRRADTEKLRAKGSPKGPGRCLLIFRSSPKYAPPSRFPPLIIWPLQIPKNARAFAVVFAASSATGTPSAEAAASAVNFKNAGSFAFPR